MSTQVSGQFSLNLTSALDLWHDRFGQQLYRLFAGSIQHFNHKILDSRLNPGKEIKVLNVTKEVSFLTLLIADSGQRNGLAFVVSN